ncbi:putative F-box domain-containing protein [Helianthus debilis subsp. tardiflorus]
MKAQCLPLDIISNLPSSIIQTILTFLPIRDAFRTSILSRKWRYHCANIPKLEFNEGMWRGGAALHDKHKLFLDMYTILLLHQCPVLEFSLSIPELRSCCEINLIILYLSRNTALEKFTLCIGMSCQSHKLPTSFFSLQNLTHLKLQKCLIPPLATLSRFGRLTSLCLYEVVTTKSTLLQFLSCCPLIRNFTLVRTNIRIFKLVLIIYLIKDLHSI